ncbi:MAG TPA: nucleoside-diphosphate sugar epimerase [Cytophagaceae bacterium]|jgi:nucleoside-diphosphate-sugar epimerase
MQTVSILGGGWVGYPLGLFLFEEGYTVKISTTSAEKLALYNRDGLNPFLINLKSNEPAQLTNFLDTDYLVVCIPPSLKYQSSEDHISQIQFLCTQIEKHSIKKIIYLSSTSIYKEENREVLESDAMQMDDYSNKTIGAVEEMFRAFANSYILRCGGLTGYDRKLLKFFVGRENLPEGNCPVNLLHRDDLLSVISLIIKSDIKGEIFNVCSPLHPSKSVFYTNIAKQDGVPAPSFAMDDYANFKIVIPEKLCQTLPYTFKFPDPLLYSYDDSQIPRTDKTQ